MRASDWYSLLTPGQKCVRPALQRNLILIWFGPAKLESETKRRVRIVQATLSQYPECTEHNKVQESYSVLCLMPCHTKELFTLASQRVREGQLKCFQLVVHTPMSDQKRWEDASSRFLS